MLRMLMLMLTLPVHLLLHLLVAAMLVRQQIDKQRNKIRTLEAATANLDEGAVRALRARNHVVEEAEAMQQGAAAALSCRCADNVRG
eukprot:3149601-Pleurochrysis_carterae.AAC.2